MIILEVKDTMVLKAKKMKIELELDETKADILFQILFRYLIKECNCEEKYQKEEIRDSGREILVELLRKTGWKHKISTRMYKVIRLQREKI